MKSYLKEEDRITLHLHRMGLKTLKGAYLELELAKKKLKRAICRAFLNSAQN